MCFFFSFSFFPLLLFFCSLALSQSALQLEKVMHVDVCRRLHKAMGYPELWENWEGHSLGTCCSLGNFFCCSTFLANFTIFSFCSSVWFFKIFLSGNYGRKRLDKTVCCLQCWASQWGFGLRGMSWIIGICSFCIWSIVRLKPEYEADIWKVEFKYSPKNGCKVIDP